MRNLAILDVVALLKDIPEAHLLVGQVGTVVELLAENVYEVEFADRKGRTLSICTLSSDDLLLLHYELESVE